MDSDKNPEFWGYYADYDWVVFCQLWGKMIDLPDKFPKFCLDVKQEALNIGMKSLGLSNFISEDKQHNAINDAIATKSMHDYIRSLRGMV